MFTKVLFEKGRTERDRMILMPLEATSANARMLSFLVCKNFRHLKKYQPWVMDVKGFPLRTDLALERLHQNATSWKRGEKATYYIFLNKKVIGGITVHNWPDEQTGELEYWLDKKATGKGYLDRAISLVEESFFKKNIKRLDLRIDPENIYSRKVAERNGYRVDFSDAPFDFENTSEGKYLPLFDLIHIKTKQDYVEQNRMSQPVMVLSVTQRDNTPHKQHSLEQHSLCRK